MANSSKSLFQKYTNSMFSQEIMYYIFITSSMGSMKFRQANISDNVVIPIEKPERRASLWPAKMLSVFIDASEGSEAYHLKKR